MIWGGQTPKFQRDWELDVVLGRGGTKVCQGRFLFTSELSPCCSWQGTSAVPGILSHHLGWLWFMPGSSGPPRAVPSSDIPYLLAISHSFHPSLLLGREVRITLLILGISWDPSYTGGCRLYGRQNICVTCELINETALGSRAEHVCPWQLRRCLPNPQNLQDKTGYHWNFNSKLWNDNWKKGFCFPSPHFFFFLELNTT